MDAAVTSRFAVERTLGAVALYFLVGLGLGFGLGAMRGVVLEPLLGPTWATVAELPVILALLWGGCGWAMRQVRLPDRRSVRAATGALWFILFLIAEFALGAVLRGWSPARTMAHFASPPGALGLAGFAIAALFPLLVRLGAPQRDLAH